MHVLPLVGRALDVAVATEQLKRIGGGVPAALLIRGDGGIGKSRLVEELLARARREGFGTLVARADDLDFGIPYAAFRDMLARLPTEEVPGDLAPLVDAFRAVLDGQLAPSAGREEPLPPVFAPAVRLLRALTRARPAVVALEDVHLADRESVALGGQLARLTDVPILTVFVTRPATGHSVDVERLVERMAYDGRGAIVDLDPLDADETTALLTGILGGAPDERLTATVFAASRGNPFFAREVVRSLVDSGAVEAGNGHVRLRSGGAAAVGLRPSVLRRLFTGTVADLDLAKVVAVFGRFSLRHLDLVGRLSGAAPDEVAASFDQLVKAGLVVSTDDGGYQFTHSIVRNALYDDIGPAERRRLHGAIAAELAKERRAGVILDAAHLATHVAESAAPGDEAAAAVLYEAGRELAATAPLVAAGHFRRAGDLLPAEAPLRGRALAGQARALHAGGRPAEAAEVGRQAIEVLPRGRVRHLVIANAITDLLIGGDAEQPLRLIDEELAAGGDPYTLLPLKTNVLLQADRPAEAAALLPEARRVVQADDAARARGDVPRLVALTQLVQYTNHAGRAQESAELLDAIDVRDVAGSPAAQATFHELLANIDWRRGLVDRLDTHLAAVRRLRPDGAGLSVGGALEVDIVLRDLVVGDWDGGLEFVRSAGFDLLDRRVALGAQLVIVGGCEMLIDRGALDEAATMAASMTWTYAAMRRAAAIVQGKLRQALGDLAGALEVLTTERAAAADGGTVWRLGTILRELIDVLVAAGQQDEARDVLAELEHRGTRTGWPDCQIPALRARAILDRDVDAARAYAVYAERERFAVEHAHALLLLGELDCSPAENLGAAYRLFDGFGAAPLRRRAAAGLRLRGRSVPRRAVQASAGLTDTEQQLVRLVREGLSNQQIATALHFSPKTIEVYLSRLYAKTGCPSRLALIRAVDSGTVPIDPS